MFDSRRQNPRCNFAEEAVSYVYDEMKTSEKVDFESHLAKCSPCADDIAAFSSVSFSLKEWRDAEFATLETPLIEIPYEATTIPTQTVQNDETNKSWIDSLSGLFDLSPAFFRTATAFGALAIVIGLGWFILGSDSGQDSNVVENSVDQSEEKDLKQNIAIAEGPEDQVIAKTEKDDIEPIETKNSPIRIIAKKSRKIASNKSKIVKVRNTPAKKVTTKSKNRKIKSNPTKKDPNLKPNKQTNNEIQEIPNLSDFAIEDTDEDLRLTDLFEDDESGD